MGILRWLANNYDYSSPANYFRRRRMRLFEEFVSSLPKPIKILDIGGTEDYWKKVGWTDPRLVNVTLVNLTREPSTQNNFSSIVGDARHLPQFADRSFDVVFSNSVIEHVGDLEDQRRMAGEIQRLGLRFFLQTPSRYFPLEPHFLFPFFGLLPSKAQAWLISHFSLGWYPRQPDMTAAYDFLRSFRLLTVSEIRSLFPHSEITREICCGFVKSYIVRGSKSYP